MRLIEEKVVLGTRGIRHEFHGFTQIKLNTYEGRNFRALSIVKRKSWLLP